MPKKQIAFSWYGGKYYHLKDILPLIPPPDVCNHFVDVFGGGGSVILNVDPGYRGKTYNDIDKELVNFFIQLRNNGDALLEKLNLTLYSREEFRIACQPCFDNLERARRFYVRIQQGFSSIPNRPYWARDARTVKKKAVIWNNKIETLPNIINMLKQIQIENRDALQIIPEYGSVNNFLYCDPPYVHSARKQMDKYVYEMTDKQHIELGRILNTIKGRAMVSGYKNIVYDQVFKDWIRIDFNKTRVGSATSYGSKGEIIKRQESVWLNYDPETWQRLAW